ncbi:hypothetical protein ACN6K9_004101 [Streptomyces sp. SAS_267]|uniref:hypothetical protein n=1 Tax=Streptomyces sp. SAS_267 TaxID=3412750 RepID=UPI00403C726C
MAFEEVVAGLVVVRPVLECGEVEGVGAEGRDGAWCGVQGACAGVVFAVSLDEECGAGTGPDRGGPFGVGVGEGTDAVQEDGAHGAGGEVGGAGLLGVALKVGPNSQPRVQPGDMPKAMSQALGLRRRGIRRTIPDKADHARNRQKLGSCGGRPPYFDLAHYPERHAVECGGRENVHATAWRRSGGGTAGGAFALSATVDPSSRAG